MSEEAGLLYKEPQAERDVGRYFGILILDHYNICFPRSSQDSIINLRKSNSNENQKKIKIETPLR